MVSVVIHDSCCAGKLVAASLMLQAVPDSLASGGDGDCSDGVLSQCVVQGLEGGEGVEVPRPGCIVLWAAFALQSPVRSGGYNGFGGYASEAWS